MRLFLSRFRPPATAFLFAWALPFAVGAQPLNAPLVANDASTSVEKRAPDRRLRQAKRGTTDLIAYSPDGRYLVTTGNSREIHIWDTRSGSEGSNIPIRTLTPPRLGTSSLGFSPDGKTVLTLSSEMVVEGWDLATGASEFETPLKSAGRTALFRPGSEPHLADATPEGVHLWNYRNGELVRQIAKGEAVRGIAFTPDGKLLAGYNRNGGIRIWNADTGELVRAFETRLPLGSIVASATQVAVSATHGGMQIWSIVGDQMLTVEGQPPMTFDASGDHFASGAGQRFIVWNLPTQKLLVAYEAHQSDLTALAFQPGGRQIASADDSGVVNYWLAPPAAPAAPRP